MRGFLSDNRADEHSRSNPERGGLPGFSAAALKYLACALMLIDHIGALLLPQYFWLRYLGRLAFPIFAFMLVNGYRYTSSPGKYLLRLSLFALGFQWFFAKIFATNMLSIFATLALGLAAIWLADTLRKKCGRCGWIAAVAVGIAAAALGYALNVDYSWYGIALIFAVWLFYERFALLSLSWLLINLAYSWIMFGHTISIQALSLLALPLLYLYNEQPGRGNKWFFYIFYCAHLVILHLIKIYLL